MEIPKYCWKKRLKYLSTDDVLERFSFVGKQ